MKRLVLILSILVMSVIVMAQAPQQFSYQALIRDAENEIISNRVITMQVSIITANGNVVYSETHQTATNENGVVSVAIGTGTTTDDFSQIDWSKGEYYLQTTIDLGAGEQLVSGNSPLLSVPYAFYAEKAGNAVEVDLSGYALKSEIPAEVDLTDYAKKSDIPETVDLSGYALKSEIPAEVDLTDYAKKSDIPEAVDLSGYALKSEIPAEVDLTDYAKKSDIPEAVDLSGYALKSEIPAEVDLTDYAKKSDIPEAVDLSGYALKSEIPDEVDLTDYAKKSDIPEAVDLSGYALKSEIPAEVDLTEYAKKSEIPEAVDLSGYALKSEIPAEVDLTDYAKKSDIPEAVDLSGYALKSEIPAEVDLTDYAKKSDIPEAVDLSGYALKSEIPAEVDLTDYAKKSDIPEAVDLSDYALKSEIPAEVDLTDYAKKSDIPEAVDLSGYALKSEIPAEVDLTDYAKKSDIPEAVDLSGYALKSEIPAEVDLSNFYLKSDVDELLAELNAKIMKLIPLEGAIQFAFSISENKQVYFSRGNLQYKVSSGTFRFAEHQYDTIGIDNKKYSSTSSGRIDLYCWGTSGYNGKKPEKKSTSTYDFGDGGNDITGTNYDWGVYNAIFNGENQAGLWRTLTIDEWIYLIQTRTDASNKYGFAKVNNICGLVLLPDNWTLPNDLVFISGNNNFSKNIYSDEDWIKMENNGAVFLPAAGHYNVQNSSSGLITNVSGVNSYGYYWSSSANSTTYAVVLRFYKEVVETYNSYRDTGLSVRLVRDVTE